MCEVMKAERICIEWNILVRGGREEGEGVSALTEQVKV